MKTMKKYLFLLGVSLLFAACGEKDDIQDLEVPKPAPEEKTEEITYTTVPYTVSVDGGAETRVHIPHAYDAELLFDEGDKLYVEAHVGPNSERCHGVLTLTSGAGTDKAAFSGNLVVPEGFKLSEHKGKVSYTLVGQDDELHTWYDSEKTILSTWRNSYFITKSLQEAVSKYSDIGYDSPNGFTDEITLRQKNSFLHFNLSIPVSYIPIDEITMIIAHIWDDYDIDIKKDIYSTRSFGLKDSEMFPGNYEFAIPYAMAGEDKTIWFITLEIVALNGRVLMHEVPVNVGGRDIKPGRVYKINQEVPVPQLNKYSLPGDIGVIEGRTGIVVDLGEKLGKVAVALYNVGVEEGDESSFGDYMTYDDFKNQWECTSHWYIPERPQLDALIYRYRSKYQFLITGEEDGTRHYSAHWEIGQNVLDIPFDYYNPYYSQKVEYWTSTPQTGENGAGETIVYSGNYIMNFLEKDDIERYPHTYQLRDRDTQKAYVRPFHDLD